jgi:hypothetical protein
VEVDVYEKKRFTGPPGPSGYKKTPNSDVFLFRLGFFDYMKLNIEAMIKKSEAEVWYNVDIILDWET